MAYMTTIEDLKRDALSLGLTDPSEVHDYVTEQQTILRDERIALRNVEVNIAEANAREAEAKLEMARIQASVGQLPIGVTHSLRSPKINLPLYHDGDDICGFITRFEKMASMLKIPNDEWVVHFSSVLTGKALEKYVTLPTSVTDNYLELKREILLGFNRTPESYRTDFRNLRISSEETFLHFVSKLRRTLELWVDSTNIYLILMMDLSTSC